MGQPIRRAFAILAPVLLLGMGSPAGSEVNTPPTERACKPRSACCRVCHEGQACGKTCISRRYTCHVGRDCACNAEEVCE
jgi:hypothetical protein